MSALSLPFLRQALLVSLLAGNALALAGLFVLLRRVSFSGLAVSQLAAFGTVLGALLGVEHAGGFPAALACVIAGMAALLALSRVRRLPEEGWVACLYVLAGGASVLLLSKHPHGEAHTMSLLFGNVLGLGALELAEAAALLAATLALLGAYFWRWLWLSFDPVSAEVAGVRARRWNAVFMALFAAGMAVGIHLFGVLLAFAYLILPAAAGLLFASRLRALLLFIPLSTSFCVLAGVQLSFTWDFPTGPFIASLLAGLTLAAGLWRLLRRH